MALLPPRNKTRNRGDERGKKGNANRGGKESSVRRQIRRGRRVSQDPELVDNAAEGDTPGRTARIVYLLTRRTCVRAVLARGLYFLPRDRLVSEARLLKRDTRSDDGAIIYIASELVNNQTRRQRVGNAP